MADPLNISWTSDISHVFSNPRLPKRALPSEWEGFSNFKRHIFLATSGTTRAKDDPLKWVALSKEAILMAADSVNKRIEASKKDIWLNMLPHFHIGGLAIFARANLTGSSVQNYGNEKWSPTGFVEHLLQSRATLTSLVPAQMVDLVRLHLKAPPSLRACFIGGGAISGRLYAEAKELLWPILPTYGMTETASQIALASFEENSLKVLPHVTLGLTSGGCLKIRSKALLTAFLYEQDGNFICKDPKKEGWYETEDLVTLSSDTLLFHGRASDWIKIGGENVSMHKLSLAFDELNKKRADACLVALDDERLGKVIAMRITHETARLAESLKEEFNSLVMPYERIRVLLPVEKIERSELGKIKLLPE